MPEHQPYRLVVVGAGFGGIGMAAALKQAGIDDFVVLDRGDDLGGIWRDNTYPGLCCDVPLALYSFSFWPWRWSRRFPSRQEILTYLRALAQDRGSVRTCASARAWPPPSSTSAARCGT
jgi:cation diffusion facilitator CzcD-associated flavoprotein CzcO